MAFNQSTDISGWVTDPMGIHAAGWGLRLHPWNGKDWAAISEWWYVGGEADYFLKMDRG